MRSLLGLREYLDEIGFANLYRYIVSVAVYPRTPRAITAWSQAAVLAVDTYLDASLDGRRLAWTLMANAGVRKSSATRQAGPKEMKGAKYFMKFGFSSSGFKPRPAKGEPAQPVASLASGATEAR